MSQKRKRGGPAAAAPAPASALQEAEDSLLEIIKSKGNMGISQMMIKHETTIADATVTKAIRSLLSKGQIKEVKNVKFNLRKHLMASEFEPSSELTGGAWYSDGALDTDCIDILKQICRREISVRKVATVDTITDAVKRSKVLKSDCTSHQVEEILEALALDNEILRATSTGMGDFVTVPAGRICYQLAKKRGGSKEPKASAMASIPCGVCPRIDHCSPDGIISPTTCQYFAKFLEF